MLTEILLYILIIVLLIGIFFMTLGTIALHRFPDVYTRLHGATKCTTFGSIFLALAVVMYSFWRWYAHGDTGLGVLGIHAILALIALLLTNPVGAHAIARASHRSGVEPYGARVDLLAIAESGGCGCSDIKEVEE